MAQPARHAPNLLEAAVEQAISICGGDVREALRASLIANSFLADEVEQLTKEVSVGFARGRISPAQRASERELKALPQLWPIIYSTTVFPRNVRPDAL